MTAPAGEKVAPADVTTTPTTPPDQQPPADVDPVQQPPADVEPVQLARLQVVTFVYADPILGTRLDGVGIVVDPDVEGTVCVVPVQAHYLFVPAGDVQVVEQDA